MRLICKHTAKGEIALDAQTFQAEAMRLEKLLYHISWSMLQNADDCADAVQEALTRAWQKRSTLKDEASFKPWLSRILVNQCRDMLRRQKKISFFPLEEAETVAVLADGELVEAIAALKPKLRLTVVLHYLEGMSVREIADVMHVPQGTVKSRLKQGRDELGMWLSAGEEAAL